VFSLAPQIERFEGRMRFTSADEEGQDDDDDGATVKQE
jgi:hypothetical protein